MGGEDMFMSNACEILLSDAGVEGGREEESPLLNTLLY